MIDQFEELFTQVDDETATRFIDELSGSSPRRAAGPESSSRCGPTSTTALCTIAASASCSATAPR